MKKFYSFLIALLAVCGLAQAQVKFDFSGDNAYEQFGLAGFSSNESHDGDFTEDVSLTYGDVTIVVSPSEKTNANRMWSGSLRLYGGTLSVVSTGKNITAIEFEVNASKWSADNTASSGTLETGKWTGDAPAVVIMIAANTQLKSMTVYMGENPGPGPGPGPDDQKDKNTIWTNPDPATNGATNWNGVYRFGLEGTDVNNECIATLPADIWNKIKTGTFCMKYTAADPGSYMIRVTTGWWSTQWLGADKDIAPWSMSERIIDNGDGTFHIEINFGDDPIVGFLDEQHLLFTGSGYTPLELYFEPETIDWTSSAEAPLTVASVLEKAGKLDKGASSDQDVFVKGKISQIKYTFSAQYGTAQFSISDDGKTENEFLCYGTYYLGNRAWADGDTQIAVGDEVIVKGTVTNYNGTLEMANKANYLYSLNGKTDGGDTPGPQAYTKIADVKTAATADKVNVEFKAADLLVTYINGKSCYVYDGTDGLLLYDMQGELKAGDKFNADITGQLYLYNGLTEIAVSKVSEIQVASSGNAVTAQVVTIADITSNYKAYENELVTIQELTPAAEAWENRNVIFTDDSDNEITVRDNFKTVADVTFDTSETYDVTGFASIYNGTVQLFPRDAADLGGEAPQPYTPQGEGTLENPYTITDILHIGGEKENGPTGWAHGYIVGYVDGTSYANGCVFSLLPEMSAKLTETDNQLILDVTEEMNGIVLSEQFVCTFEGDAIKSSVITYTFPSEEIAQAFYAEMLAEQQADPEENPGVYAINGNVITNDMTDYMAGATKDMIRTYLQMMADEINGQGSTPSEPSNTNILIADMPGEDQPALCVPVQLANKLGMREALSLKDVPENWGKEIWLHGEFIKYFNVPGVKNVDDWSFDGKTLNTLVKSLTRIATDSKNVFNLNGQRVNNVAKPGIYVVGGRKVVVK
ncbi:MAG: hypothetical protein J5545_01100 [Bacteroidaceae bacterium]|nr:hypothetical protein [Bacteroidaceae bacterium]